MRQEGGTTQHPSKTLTVGEFAFDEDDKPLKDEKLNAFEEAASSIIKWAPLTRSPWKVGQALLQVKKLIGHGYFSKFQASLDISPSTARWWMQVARAWKSEDEVPDERARKLRQLASEANGGKSGKRPPRDSEPSPEALTDAFVTSVKRVQQLVETNPRLGPQEVHRVRQALATLMALAQDLERLIARRTQPERSVGQTASTAAA